MPATTDPLLCYTVFDNVLAVKKTERADVPWSDLVDRIRNAPEYAEKRACPLISLAEYGDTLSNRNSYRHAANVKRIFGVELDYDAQKVTLQAAAEMLRAARLKAVLYTSPSHTPEAPRWRILLPLAEPATGDKRADLVGRVNAVIGGIASPESFVLSQSFYIGRVKGTVYEVAETDGRCVDEATDLTPVFFKFGKDDGSSKYDPRTDAELREAFARGEGRYEAMKKLSARWAARGMAADDIEAALVDLLGSHHENDDGVDLRERARQLARSAAEKFGETRKPKTGSEVLPTNVTLHDFYAYMPEHRYIFVPTRDTWPASSVNSRIETDDGKATEWLDENRSVEQMTWVPGEPMVIEDRLVSNGGWISRPGVRVFNQYIPPQIETGDPDDVDPWLEHVVKVYGDCAPHIVSWLAHRVQRPGEKINHALVLGGNQGIGKDTLLEPVKYAVGAWNFNEVQPGHLLGRFNGFVKSVILRVSEARDLGDIDRYSFYDHLKVYTAAPPDVLRCDEKNIREYAVFNVMGVIITSNHKADGIYLPADDRRHYVAWSDLSRGDFPAGYWQSLYRWYADGGIRNVAAYLAKVELTAFDPKAPPPQTSSFWDIVDANRAPEDAEMADAIDRLGKPAAITLDMVKDWSTDSMREWLVDRRNRRQIPHRLEAAGYVPVRNASADDGLWRFVGSRKVVYAKRELPERDRIAAAAQLTRDGR